LGYGSHADILANELTHVIFHLCFAALFLGMDDEILIVETATVFVERMGTAAIEHLEEQAELAASAGDDLSEEAWRDIAEAAIQLVQAASARRLAFVALSVDVSGRTLFPLKSAQSDHDFSD
jgi:hypothetical protein